MPPDSFRDIFHKVFQIRLTYPEVGVLLSILDVGGNGALDGAKFLNWLFKISRKEEKFMLGTKTFIVCRLQIHKFNRFSFKLRRVTEPSNHGYVETDHDEHHQ